MLSEYVLLPIGKTECGGEIRKLNSTEWVEFFTSA
jgi:hypothetical protein